MAFNFRPDDELAGQLKEQAATEHTSVQALLSRAAEEYLSRHRRRERIDRGLDLILVNSADALKRLGEGA